MATLRTFEEKMAIVAHCVELEKAGGDILGYLWSENYLTPKATWFNFQREWLHRKPYEFTDGKPKGEKNMAKRRAMTDEERAKAVEIAMDGRDPRVYLEEIGVADPAAMWAYIKQYYKKNAPEVYEKIPKRIGRVAKPETETPTLKVDGPLKIETPEANKVTVAEVPEKAVKPAITQPVVYDGMTIREIEGLFGRYRRTDIHGAIYIDYENPDGADVLSYTVDQWRKWQAERKNAFQILGVEL